MSKTSTRMSLALATLVAVAAGCDRSGSAGDSEGAGSALDAPESGAAASATSGASTDAAAKADPGAGSPGPIPPLPDLSGIDLPEGVTAASIAAGEEVFMGPGACWACHDADASGTQGVGANLRDDEWWHTDGTYERLVARILAGVPTDSVRNELKLMMPPKGGASISDEQVRAVAAFVWSLRVR